MLDAKGDEEAQHAMLAPRADIGGEVPALRGKPQALSTGKCAIVLDKIVNSGSAARRDSGGV